MQSQGARSALDLQKTLNSVKTSAGLEGQNEAGLSLSMGQCWVGVSCAPTGVQGCGSSESRGWAWLARQNESLCWQQVLCWVSAGMKLLAVPGNRRCVPRDGDRSLLLLLLSWLPGWWQGHGLSFPWWEIYKIQPVPTSPCYLWQAGRSASLFVEGQLSPWLPAHTQPCTHSASSQHVSQPAWDRESFHRRRKVLSALSTWSVSAI